MNPNGIIEKLAELRYIIRLANPIFFLRHLHVPILCNLRFWICLAQIDAQAVPGQEFADAVKHCVGGRDITQGKKLGKSTLIEAWVEVRNFKQSFDFGSKRKPVPCHGIIEWLDSQAVSRAEQTLVVCVPNCKGKHAAQMFNTAVTILLVKVKDGFCVATGCISVTAFFQCSAEF